MKKIYRGERLNDKNGVNVKVNNLELEGNNFNWGQLCQGSYNLAYAILLDYFEGDEVRALKYCKAFQRKLISIIPTDIWVLPDSGIKSEIEKIKNIKKKKLNSVTENGLVDSLVL